MRAPRPSTRLAVHLVVVLATCATLYPVLLVLKKAFEPGQEFALSARPLPARVTLAHFRDVLGQPHALGFALNSFVVALATTAVGVLLSCTAAYALSRPAIAVTALFSFMTAWNEFILAGTFMTDERGYTLPVLLHHYIGEYHAEWGHFAAGALLTSLPVMALFYVLQRYLVGGLTAGAVKS